MGALEPIFTPAELAEVQRYHAPGYTWTAISMVVTPVLMVLLTRYGTGPLWRWSERLAARARPRVPSTFAAAMARVWRGPEWLESMVFSCLLVVIFEVTDWPSSVYFGFIREHEYGMAKQSFALFVWDGTKGTLIFLASMLALTIGLFGLARRYRWWWWVLGVVASGAMLFATYADPYRGQVYFDRESLAQGPLRTRMTVLMAKAGIEVKDIVVEKIASRTVRLQAYFAGQGMTRTIVLTDTLVQALNEDEVLAVVAHEAGHVGESRTLGRVGSVLTLMFFLFLVERMFRASVARGWFGITARGDVRLLPLIILVFDLAATVGDPLSAAWSRRGESAADAYAVRLTGDPDAFRSMLVKAARINKMNPDPPRWYVLAGVSHPPIAERLADIAPSTPQDHGRGPTLAPPTGSQQVFPDLRDR